MNQTVNRSVAGRIKSFRLTKVLNRERRNRQAWALAAEDNLPPPNIEPTVARLALTYVVSASLVATLFVPRLFASEEVALVFQLAFWIVLALAIYRWVGGVLLIATIAYLLWREPRGLLERDYIQVAMLSGLGLLLVLLVSRFRTMMDLLELKGMRGVYKLWQSAWPAWVATGSVSSAARPVRQTTEVREIRRDGQQASGQQASGQQASKSPAAWWLELVWIPLGVGASLSLAWLVLALVPLDPSSRRILGLLPSGLRTIQLAFLLSITFWVVQVFIHELAWRQTTPAQARLYLRGIAVAWLHRDVAWLVRGRRKLNNRIAKAKSR